MPTIRKYSDRELPASLICEIVEASTLAPTTGNMQLYTVIATDKSSPRRAALNGTHFNQPAAVGAPVLLTICADFNRFSRWCELSEAQPGYDNFVSFISAMLDATVLAQQLTVEADKRGLGTCYLGTTLWNADQIAGILDLPPLVVPVIALSIGYPAEDHVDTGRLPVEAVLSWDTYPRRTDKEIKALYRKTEERDDSKQFAMENGLDTLAQVFTKVRYPKAMNEEFSVKVLDFLRKSGFLK